MGNYALAGTKKISSTTSFFVLTSAMSEKSDLIDALEERVRTGTRARRIRTRLSRPFRSLRFGHAYYTRAKKDQTPLGQENLSCRLRHAPSLTPSLFFFCFWEPSGPVILATKVLNYKVTHTVNVEPIYNTIR